MRVVSTKVGKIGAAVLLIIVALGGGIWWWKASHRVKTVYTPQGYGGYVPQSTKKPEKPADPLHLAVDAYNSRNYEEAEGAAQEIIDRASKSSKLSERKKAAKARYVLAFSAARQKDMELARERFAVLKEEASKLPDKGKQRPQAGLAPATLEEEGAYQHAVCTAALGDKKAAEEEYLQFMRDYPESPLVDGAIRRIEQLHEGHLPPDAEAVWEKARKIAQTRSQARQKALMKAQSMCGPECLAELLRRRGEKADVKALAEEMKTNEEGTSLLSLALAAGKHGFDAKGLKLTQNGLLKQPLPLIALIRPGHYVVVDSVSRRNVLVWNPYGKGLGKPSTQRYSLDEWQRAWSGIALALQLKADPARTAQK